MVIILPLYLSAEGGLSALALRGDSKPGAFKDVNSGKIKPIDRIERVLVI
jgi:hypothetical protein